MAGTEIDFGNIQPAATPQQTWKPPKHVYFGPKDPATGQMVDEPEYVYQPYPCMRFRLENGKIQARQCYTAEEEAALGEGWYDTPAAFGAVTAPSFEQSRKPAVLTQPKKAEAK